MFLIGTPGSQSTPGQGSANSTPNNRPPKQKKPKPSWRPKFVRVTAPAPISTVGKKHVHFDSDGEVHSEEEEGVSGHVTQEFTGHVNGDVMDYQVTNAGQVIIISELCIYRIQILKCTFHEKLLYCINFLLFIEFLESPNCMYSNIFVWLLDGTESGVVNVNLQQMAGYYNPVQAAVFQQANQQYNTVSVEQQFNHPNGDQPQQPYTPDRQAPQQSPYTTTQGPPQPEESVASPSSSTHSHVVQNTNNSKPRKPGDLFAQAQVFNRKK